MKRSQSLRRVKSKDQSPSSDTHSQLSTGSESNPNVITAFTWGWYLFSLLIPFAGIFIALLLYDQDSREVRKVGRNCLLIGFLIWVVFPVLLFLALLLLGAMTAAAWVSDMMPSTD